jgi:hypothetical protein
MNKGGKKLEKSTIYRIKVQGELHQKWSNRLGGMSITTDRIQTRSSVIILEGCLRDQAALAGVLKTLYELRLSILSIECLDKK